MGKSFVGLKVKNVNFVNSFTNPKSGSKNVLFGKSFKARSNYQHANFPFSWGFEPNTVARSAVKLGSPIMVQTNDPTVVGLTVTFGSTVVLPEGSYTPVTISGAAFISVMKGTVNDAKFGLVEGFGPVVLSDQIKAGDLILLNGMERYSNRDDKCFEVAQFSADSITFKIPYIIAASDEGFIEGMINSRIKIGETAPSSASPSLFFYVIDPKRSSTYVPDLGDIWRREDVVLSPPLEAKTYYSSFSVGSSNEFSGQYLLSWELDDSTPHLYGTRGESDPLFQASADHPGKYFLSHEFNGKNACLKFTHSSQNETIAAWKGINWVEGTKVRIQNDAQNHTVQFVQVSWDGSTTENVGPGIPAAGYGDYLYSDNQWIYVG